MSSYTTAVSREQQEVSTVARPRGGAGGLLLPAFSLWWREIVRFYRMPTRVVGVIASPVMFWLVLGSGFGSSLRTGSRNYLEYFFPGALIMIVLFTSIFAMMSVIEDRREGFLLSVLVAPVSRAAIVLGKVLGGTTLATIQGLLFLAFASLIGIHFTLTRFAEAVLCILLVSFSLTALGFIVAWRLDSTQAFHAIINLFLMPLWMLSGSLFPVSGAASWIAMIMRANPLTYGVEALRASLYPQMSGGLALAPATCLMVLGGFALIMFAIAFVMVNRRRATPSA